MGPELTSFGGADWAVVCGVFLVTTILGLWLGRHGSLRDYFLAGRRLPWWAVSASIVATEISAVTLVSVPFVVFKPGGNFAYLQLVLIGSVLARLAIAWWLVPAYFEREIYSPYDYVGARLGRGAKTVTSLLFTLGGVLSQAARVYLTALVLEIVLHEPLTRLSETLHVPTLALSIALLTIVAVLWTWVGGMATVVWTDFVLFLVFTASAIVLLFVIAGRLDLGWERIWRVGVDAHKSDLFDFDTSPVKPYTFWAAAIAWSWSGIASYGVDQLMAQRLFCCADVRAARKAIAWSSIGVVVPVLVAFVGVGLFAYYERHPMNAETLALYEKKGENLLLVFTTAVVPSGWKGLIVAGILAAAITSLDGALTALSQTTLSIVRGPRRQLPVVATQPATAERGSVRRARLLVLVFGLALAVIGFAMDGLSASYGSILDLALSMAAYTQGALLAGLALALLAPHVGGAGFTWSAPFSVALVFAVSWHGPVAVATCDLLALAFVVAWVLWRGIPDVRRGNSVRRAAVQFGFVLLGAALLSWTARHGLFAAERGGRGDVEWLLVPLAFPWYVPLASTVAFALGLVWARETDPSLEPETA